MLGTHRGYRTLPILGISLVWALAQHPGLTRMVLINHAEDRVVRSTRMTLFIGKVPRSFDDARDAVDGKYRVH